MKNRNALIIFSLVILVLFFSIKGLILASSFFIPLAFAVLLMLISIPLARKLEKLGLSRTFASLSCVILVILAYLSFFLLITVQGKNISEKWPEMKEKIAPKFEETLNRIEEKTGLNLKDQLPAFAQNQDESEGQPQDSEDQAIEKETQADESTEQSEESEVQSQGSGEKESSGVPSGIPGKVAPIAMNIFGFFGSSVMTFVYIFFLLSFRAKVKRSILLFFDLHKRNTVEKILNKSVGLVLSFLGGRFLLILFLAIIYSIGLLIAGVENAIVISLMAALFSLIPYLGVMSGFLLAITFTLLGGGDSTSLIIVAATYGIAQFVESNILEPYIVGNKVNLNPLMTIVVVIAGGMIWGVAGMVLSIPFTAILKIIFDTIDPLKPLGYLLGGEETDDSEESAENEQPEESSGRLAQLKKSLWERLKGK